MALKHVYDLTRFRLCSVFLFSIESGVPLLVVELYPAGGNRYVALCWWHGFTEGFYKVFFVEGNDVSAAVGAIVRDIEKECNKVFDIVVEVV